MTTQNPFDPGYLTELELRAIGFKSIGSNVAIAKNCTIIGVANISIANNVRIDGYSTIIAADADVVIGSYVHISAYCLLSGGDGIEMRDFAGLSHGVKIYSRSDDFSGEYLTNPTVPEQYTGGSRGKVTLDRHVIVGSSSVILPDVHIGEGSSIGALSLVTKSLDSWGVYSGCPVTRVKSRSRNLLELEQQLIEEGSST